MSPERWKRHERHIARLLEGRRLPNNGAVQPGVRATTPARTLAVQIKTRKAVPAWLSAAIGLATRDAAATAPGSVPVVVIAHPTPSVESRRYAVLKLGQPAALLTPEAVAGAVPGTDPIAAKEIRTGKIDHCQEAFAIDFGLIHAHARETADRTRMNGIAERPKSDGAGQQVVENPYENARKGPLKPSSAPQNTQQRSKSP